MIFILVGCLSLISLYACAVLFGAALLRADLAAEERAFVRGKAPSKHRFAALEAARTAG